MHVSHAVQAVGVGSLGAKDRRGGSARPGRRAPSIPGPRGPVAFEDPPGKLSPRTRDRAGTVTRKARILVTTQGSLGDVHPFFAIALELKARGHDVTLAANPDYAAKVEALGIPFAAVPPSVPDPERDADLVARVRDERTGHEHLIRELILPALPESYARTLAAAAGAEVIVGHSLSLVTRLVAEKTGVPWISCCVQPLSFFSVHDPPILIGVPELAFLRRLPLPLYRAYFWLVKRSIRSWGDPVRRLRTELGLGPAPDPLFEGLNSDLLVLALYTRPLGPPQPDWPPHVKVTGFCFYDGGEKGISPELARFLDAGDPPLVFTLGSWTSGRPGAFLGAAVEAARLLGRRAVFTVGRQKHAELAALPPGVLVTDYAPFSQLLPRSAALVHPGGIGTIALALRAGTPQLLVPSGSTDQPDNADRTVRLGAARLLTRRQVGGERLARELEALLQDSAVREKAAAIRAHMATETGAGSAADAVEELLEKRAEG